MKKIIALSLLAAMLLSVCACAGETAPSGVGDSGMPDVTTVEETTDDGEPTLPTLDCGDGEFRMLIRQAGTYNCDDVYVESLDGEIVNDAVYNRNLNIEAKFNVKLTPNFNENVAGVAQKSIMANEDLCDVMFDSMNVLSSLMTNKQLIDLNTLDYIDWDAAYWDSNAAEQLSVMHKVYMAVSDISMNASSRARFIYFNKALVENYNLSLPYDLVYANKWTLDSFGEMVKGVSEDLNGDGKMDGNDRFGILQEGPSFFISGAGIRLTENDSEGVPQIAFMNENTVDALEKIKSIISDASYALGYEGAAKGMDTSAFPHIYNFGRSLFASDHFLFVQNGANVANQFTNMESPFGIVPNPKYDENQDSYYHLMDIYACAMAIPITSADTDRTAIILEYMSWLSSRTLVPAYYDTTIKVKRFNDEQAPEMLDMVRASILYEISSITNMGIGDVITSAYNSGNLASTYAKSEEKINNKITDLVAIFAEG